MKYPSTISIRTKVLVALFVVTALASLVKVASRASNEATLAKSAEFEAAAALQLAARERLGHKLAAK
jgi:cbb3-type cytochrome oxidase cytochrome c subunit